jgi:hypothetical protein
VIKRHIIRVRKRIEDHYLTGMSMRPRGNVNATDVRSAA